MTAALWQRLGLLLVGFGAVALAAEVLTRGLGWQAAEPAGSPARSRLIAAWLEREQVEDVLVIGSSRVAGGLHAEVANEHLARVVGPDVSLYKLGLGGLRPPTLARLIEHGVARRPPKQLLVLAVEARFFARPVRDDGGQVRGEWELDDLATPLSETLVGLERLWSAPFFLDPDRRADRRPIRERQGEHKTLAQRLEGDANARAKAAQRGDLFELEEGYSWHWPDADTVDRQAWGRVLELVSELPCPTLLIRMPLLADFDRRRMPEVSVAFFRDVIEPSGLPFEDLADRPPFPTEARFFKSETHLAHPGTLLTSRLLVEQLLASRLSSTGGG